MVEAPATKPPLKARARTTIRKFALELAILVGGTWFTAWLAQKGAFTDPQGQINAVGTFLLWLTAQGWFQWLSGIVLGFTAGAWIDARLRVKDVPQFLWHKLHRRVPGLEDVYRNDFKPGALGTFSRTFKDDYEITLADKTTAKFHASVVLWIEGRIVFPVFYIFPTGRLPDVCRGLIEHLNTFLALRGDTELAGGGRQLTTTGDMAFSGRVFVYYDPALSSAQLAEIEKLFSDAGLSVQIRGVDWAIGTATGDGSIYLRESQRQVRLTEGEDGKWKET